MKKIINLLVCLIILLSFTINLYAESSITMIDAEKCKKELLIPMDNDLLLNKTWYGRIFKVAPDNKQVQSVDEIEYFKALLAVDYPIEDYTIYFLDYKSLDRYLAMTLKDNSTVVFGVDKALSIESIHMIAVHELGHFIHFRYMTDTKWQEYKELRGITDNKIYNNTASSPIYDRPQEIFAEDFRFLYGNESATSIEHLNTELINPAYVIGLKEFFESLKKQ